MMPSRFNVRCALIPHAGIQYAGDARLSAFKNFNSSSVETIIYIATNHLLNPGDITYILYNDTGYKLPNNINQEYIENSTEHSFKFVENELKSYFNHAKIFAIGPNQYNYKLKDWLINFMNKHDKCILLATTDLSHYGTNFNNNLHFQFPQQLYKQKYEESFISALTNKPINMDLIDGFIKQENLMCGPMATKLFIEVCKGMEYTGKVVDYYDSYGISKRPKKDTNDLLDRYTIQPTNIKNLVSYVSIIYGNGINQNNITQFDILMGIGLLKSVIMRHLYNKEYNLKLPKWSPFYAIHNGIFVGSSIGDQTNCSYGRYESNKQSTAINIHEAANDCPKDTYRWNTPYSISKLGKTHFKIELLQSKREWRTYNAKDIYKYFEMNGKQGIFLILPSKRSATYLPVVSRDNLNWSINKYMSHLSRKAGGEGDEWRKGTIQIYESTSYTWNPETQQLEVF